MPTLAPPQLRGLVSDPLAADQLPEGVTDAAAHPFVVFAVIAAAVAYVLATAVAKVAEPVSSAIQRYRDHRQATEDARIRDLDRQVDHLLGRVTLLERRQQRQDTFLSAHAVWDRKVLAAAIRLGLDPAEIGDPPPLWPTFDN